MQAKLTNVTVKQFDPKENPYEVVDTELKGFLMRVQPSGRKTFYFSYRADGVRKRIKVGVLGNVSVRVARDEAEMYSASVTKGLDVQAKKKNDKRRVLELRDNTLEKFLDKAYKPWVLANRKSGQETLARINREFPDYYRLPLEEINVLLVEKWRTKRLQKGIKSTTINRSVAGLRAVLSKAVEWDVITDHPLAKLKPLRVDRSPKVRYLSKEEEGRLNVAMNQREEQLKADRESGNAFRERRGYSLYPDLRQNRFADRLTPMILLSLKTGMRKGEIFDVEWPDIDFRRKVLTVKGENAKSNQTRHIPLSMTALEALKDWGKQSPNNEGRVFPSNSGERLDNVKKSWASLLKLAKIENFRWHDMRHDFASKLVMNGVPLNTVRELCGHADLNTTLRYAHLAPDHKAEAVELLG